MTQQSENFWETKTLAQMTKAEWESLCDSCARCCLHKFEDEDTRQVVYSDVVCALLDHDTCRCTDYANRRTRVPDCLELSVDNADHFRWLPDTCAYRLLYEGKSLFDWHPLISGTAQSVHEAGISVQGRCMVETYIHPDEISHREASWITCSKPLDTN